ncbi:MAG: sialate O-acetylesterase [Bacteroidetes bacterium]|nr:sialate O-acetylesterase [Bacteroidota bacterium]
MNKKLTWLLVISLALNGVLLVYAGRHFYYRFVNNPAVESTRPADRPKLSHFMGKDDVFQALPDDSNEVIMLGNSLTDHFEWHELFPGVNIKNRGIHADQIQSVKARIDEVIRSKPKAIFLEIGINDLIKGRDKDSVLSDYLGLVNVIRSGSGKTQLFIQSLLPTNRKSETTGADLTESVKYINEQLKDYCRKNQFVFIDLYAGMVENGFLKKEFDSGDGLHLSGKGYLYWISQIESYVLK